MLITLNQFSTIPSALLLNKMPHSYIGYFSSLLSLYYYFIIYFFFLGQNPMLFMYYYFSIIIIKIKIDFLDLQFYFSINLKEDCYLVYINLIK